ncbi:MAG: preprotein translocase subunit YajC [Deltaproteobacteria bacterium]|nr:preprotein translocase subunit YajC [Deltaproteobacteria bacterium]MBW2414032.1 preprotein translocase subunit YajC [Deltaproteobacteria bacterium]
MVLGALFLVMYALIIHPQRKQQKEQAKMLGELSKGDAVVTTGGIYGRITGIADDVLTVEIGDGTKVKVKMERSAVKGLQPSKPEGGTIA